jgi:hypothetical protein
MLREHARPHDLLEYDATKYSCALDRASESHRHSRRVTKWDARNGLHVCKRADVVCEDRYLLRSGSRLLLCLCRRLLRLLPARIEEAAASAGWRVRSGSSAAVTSLSQTAFCTLLKCAESSSDRDSGNRQEQFGSATRAERTINASVGSIETL